MSLWWGSTPIDAEVQRATSSSIPSGDQDLALNLEICDTVRSKQATPKDTLRALKRRLYDTNPNVQILTLHLLDLLVKNGGAHFFTEFAGKEFVDAYVAELLSLHNQKRNFEVIGLMLEYLQTWARASVSKPEAKYLQDRYNELKRRKDIDFPETGTEGEISSSFLESATAPEWTDSDTCMKSGQAFSFYNRKHHCRNCGGVFMQEYCANFIPLPHFGINIPVRVCDDCNAQVTRKSQRDHKGSTAAVSQGPTYRGIASNNRDMGSRFRHDLEEAINLSLKSTPQKNSHPVPAPASTTIADDDGMDEDVRRAIEASLAELRPQSHSEPAPQPNIADFGVSEPQAPAPAIPTKDREIIETYISMVHNAEPREAIYNTQLTDLNRKAIELQPKVISELKLSTSKLGTLEDLNGKLLAVASYYDQLLEAELNPGQYVPSIAPQTHTYRQPPGAAYESNHASFAQSPEESKHSSTQQLSTQSTAADELQQNGENEPSSGKMLPKDRHTLSHHDHYSGGTEEPREDVSLGAPLSPPADPHREPVAEVANEPEPEPTLIEL